MPTIKNQRYWEEKAGKLQISNEAFINGAYRPAVSGETYDCVSAIDGRSLARIASCDGQDVDLAVQAARAAFDKAVWRGLSTGRRKKTLLRFADLMRENRDELALLETLDMGKPISDALAIDVAASADTIAWYAEAIDKVYGEIAPTAENVHATVSREPIGVVAAVVPWNFPLLMACWKIGPALAAGNSIIVKPAEQSPLTLLKLAFLASQAGIPDGVFNVIPGYGDKAGKAIGLHMDIDVVAFTGSTEVGKLFMTYSGTSNLKQINLECGGKSPNIIMSDVADLEVAADAAVSGIFFNQGQICNAGSRLLVQSDIKDRLMELLVEKAKKYMPAHPLNPETITGAMVDQHHADRVMDYIRIGQEEGAGLLIGGGKAEIVRGGNYIMPTIFDNVVNDMTIAREEIFGPVLSVITFDSPEEAVTIANDTMYGLAAGVWTRDVRTAHIMTKKIHAGIVYVNCYDQSNITVPFGGFKQSGFGRDKSLHALEKYTQLKTAWINLA